MPRSTYADVQLDVDAGGALPALDPITPDTDDDQPFRILVIGDFGARAEARPMEIDRDNFEDVLEDMDVRASIAGLDLRFLSMADFHPDELRHRVPAGVMKGPSRPAARREESPAESGVEAALGGSLLDAALDATEARSTGAPPPVSADPFTRYLKSIVDPHLTAPEAKADFSDAIQVMRALLHHPRFQEIESAWRALHRLVFGLETGPGFSIHVLQLSKADLAADLGEADDLRKTALYRVLTGHKWAVVAANYEISAAMEDLNLIARSGMVAKQARAVLLAGASPALVGCQSLTENPYPDEWNGETEREGWDLIRSLPEARNVGLVMPRFLLRTPYGKEGETCDEFPFEEMNGTPRHEDFLWGNGAFAAAYLLGAAYSAMGWRMRPGAVSAMEDLPLPVYRDEAGQSQLKPAAEVFLGDQAVEVIQESGLMPLVCMPDSGAVRIAGFRSIASPASALEGPWT